MSQQISQQVSCVTASAGIWGPASVCIISLCGILHRYRQNGRHDYIPSATLGSKEPVELVLMIRSGPHCAKLRRQPHWPLPILIPLDKAD